MKKQSLVENILVFMFGIVGSKLILFFMLPLYTNVLTPDEYGQAELLFTTVQLLTPIVSLAIYNGELRYGLSDNFNNSQVAKCTLIVSFIALLLTYPLSYLVCLYKPLEGKEFYIFIYIATTLFSNISMIYLKIKNKNKIYSLLSVLQTLVLASLNILLLIVYPLGVNGYIISCIVSTGIIAFIAFLSSKYYKDIIDVDTDFKFLIKICRYSTPFILNDIAWWIIHASDKYMITSMISISVAGIYTAASKIPSVINSLSSIFSQAWMISAVQEYESDKENKIFYDKIFNNYYITMFFITFIAIASSGKFIQIYLGDKFYDAQIFVPIMLLSILFGAIATYTTSIFSALEKSKYIMYTTLLAAFTNIMFNYLFIPVYGAWGACLATLISYFFLMLIRMILVYKFINLNFDKYRFTIAIILISIEVLVVTLNKLENITSIVITIIFFIIWNKERIYIYLYIKERFLKWRVNNEKIKK